MKQFYFTLILVIFSFSSSFASSYNGVKYANKSISWGGVNRYFDYYVPTGYSGDLPMVFVLHGHGGTKDEIDPDNPNGTASLATWYYTADDNGFVLIIPDGTIGPDTDRGWNDCRVNVGNPTTDDVGFLRTLIDWMVNEQTDVDVDDSKVYFVGHSNGGHMSIRMALEANDVVAAVAPVSASLAETEYSQCGEATNPIGFGVMNGTLDPFLPYTGGDMAPGRGKVKSTVSTATYFKDNANCSSTSIKYDYSDISVNDNTCGDPSTIDRWRYYNCDESLELYLFKVVDGGHAEPAMADTYGCLTISYLGNQNMDIEHSDEIWNLVFDGTILGYVYLGPYPPIGLKATSSANGSVTLEWSDHPADSVGDGYNIYRSTSAESGFAKLNSSLLTSANYTDDTITTGNNFYYKVTSYDNGALEESKPSNTFMWGITEIFVSGFERSLANDQWSCTNGLSRTANAAYEGDYGLSLYRDNSSASREFDTIVYTNCKVDYALDGGNLDANEYIILEWSIDGNNWSTIEALNSVNSSGWVVNYSTLGPSSASANLQIRIRQTGGDLFEYGYADKIKVQCW